MTNVMSKFGDFYRDHKGMIILVAGVIGAVVIKSLLTKNNSEEQEIVVEPTKVEQDWDLCWIQSNDPNKTYTIDMPVSNNKTLENHVEDLKADLESGNWHKADL